jgi:uncharacterized protein YcbK (DUF882 family)
VGDLTPNFSRCEFACRCGCGFDAVDLAIVAALQELRGMLGQPISVTSGCRCQEHNRRVGGTRNSRHLTGHAADVTVRGLSPVDVYREALGVQAFRDGGIGIYSDRGFTHLDIRPVAARWAEVGGRRVSYYDLERRD